MAVPYTFATATSAIPLSQLDSNFATTITLGNTAIQLGNTVTTLNNMTLANVTISSGGSFTSNSISTSGNLTFTGTGNRILGDFSNATVASRVFFQTSTVNGNSQVRIIPNGIGNTTSIQTGNSSDPSNSSVAVLAATSTEVQVISANNGTGTLLPMTFYTGGSERMRVDTSGNVGIGTSSPTTKLDNTGSFRSTGATDPTSGTGLELGYRSTFGDVLAYNRTSSAFVELQIRGAPIIFGNAGGERMRIDSNGRLYLNTTAAVGALAAYQTIVGNANSLSIMTLQDTGTTYGAATQYITFANSSATVAGSIQHNAAGTVNYATSSDFRLKENIVDSSDALSVVDAIKVRAFDWKEDNGHVDFGFIAQELHQHYPDAVCAGDNDAELTEPKGTWQVDYGKLTPLLLKAIQELKAELDVCKAEIAALKGAK